MGLRPEPADADNIPTATAAPELATEPGKIGTPLTKTATRVVLLGAGPLGKELAIALQNYGVEVVAVGVEKNAPAMQVAHRQHVIDLLDSDALLDVLAIERPHIVIPEAGVIESSVLGEIEAGGARIVPSALAVQITMNREILRRQLAEDIGLPTPRYRFAGTYDEVASAVAEVGMPALIKPVLSAGGSGHAVIRTEADIAPAWQQAQHGGWRGDDDDGSPARVIVEEFLAFDAEVQVVVVRHIGGLTVCQPFGTDEDAGYVHSWQPCVVSLAQWQRISELAVAAVQKLPGFGVFTVELFLVGDQILVSEVIPRPTNAGLVTLVSQRPNEFDLQARAILGLPLAEPAVTPGAAKALRVVGKGKTIFGGLVQALEVPATSVRLFGEPKGEGHRLVGVALATADDVATACDRAAKAAAKITTRLV